MKPKDIRDLVWFSDDEARHETLFETEHLWSEIVCLQGAQGLGPLTDPASDAIVTVLAGEVAVQVGKGRARMGQWEAVLVEAGTELTIRNASDDPGRRPVRPLAAAGAHDLTAAPRRSARPHPRTPYREPSERTIRSASRSPPSVRCMEVIWHADPSDVRGAPEHTRTPRGTS